MSDYTNIRRDIKRWDNLLNKLRRDVTKLKKQGALSASNRLLQVGGTLGSDNTSTVTGDGLANSYLGRIYLSTATNIGTNQASAILTPGNWTSDFDVGADSAALLQTGHHFTVPTTVNNIDLTGKKVYVQVTFSLGYESLNDTIDSGEHSGKISIHKNDNTVVSTATKGFAIHSGGIDSIWSDYYTMTAQDIVECDPGDTLDFYIVTTNYKMTFYNGTETAYATFVILNAE